MQDDSRTAQSQKEGKRVEGGNEGRDGVKHHSRQLSLLHLRSHDRATNFHVNALLKTGRLASLGAEPNASFGTIPA